MVYIKRIIIIAFWFPAMVFGVFVWGPLKAAVIYFLYGEGDMSGIGELVEGLVGWGKIQEDKNHENQEARNPDDHSKEIHESRPDIREIKGWSPRGIES